MADYIEPVKIEDLPDKESLEESDFFVVEDTEATKKSTIEKLKSSIGGIDKITPYFAVSESTTFYPSHEGNTASILGTMILGTARIGDTGVWETEVPNTTEYDYIWVSFYVEYADGTTEWMHPFTVTDKEAKETIAVLVKEMETAQADILKNSGLIAENAELLEEVSEKAAENTEQIEELSENVSANTDKIAEIEKSLEDTDENVSKLDERVSTAETNIDDLKERVSTAEENIESLTEHVSYFDDYIITIQSDPVDVVFSDTQQYVDIKSSIEFPETPDGYRLLFFYCESESFSSSSESAGCALGINNFYFINRNYSETASAVRESATCTAVFIKDNE